MKRLIFLCLGLFFLVQLNSQAFENRYQDPIFSNVTETNEIKFSTAVPQPRPGGGFYAFVSGLPVNVREHDTEPVNLYLDVFEPAGDTISKRPAVIICFGGGFLSGSKDHWSMRLLAQELAKLGFVAITIDYRLGMNVFDSDLANRAVYRGVQDGRSAVRFLKADAAGANTFRIDTNNIYIGGHSSGAFIGIHNAYLDKESERPLSTYNWTQSGNPVADQLCLDCVGDNQTFSGAANAVFSLAGGIGFTSYIESANDPSIVMFHSTDDGTVPYTSGEPFSSIIWLVVGSDLPDVHGSLPMSQQMDIVGLPYEFYSYTNRGHGVHENGGSQLYNDIIPGISDWFYEELLKPEVHSISGRDLICQSELEQSYTVPSNLAEYYDWQVSGGSFINPDAYSAEATVLWDLNAAQHSITVTPYSCNGARGDTVSMQINLVDVDDNIWLIGNGDWNNPSNWSLGHLPLICENVIFPAEASNELVTVPSSTLSEIRSLNVGSNVILESLAGSKIHVIGGGQVIIDGTLILDDSLLVSNLSGSNLSNVVVNGQMTIHSNGVLQLDQEGMHNLSVEAGANLFNEGRILLHSINPDPSIFGLRIAGNFYNMGGLLRSTGLMNQNEIQILNTGQLSNTVNGSIEITN